MIATFIENYGKLGVQGIVVIMGAWVVWYLLRTVMGMFKNELQSLEKIGQKSVEQNTHIAVIQERTLDKISSNQNESRTVWNKLCETLDNLLRNSNGGNPEVVKLRKELDEIKIKLGN